MLSALTVLTALVGAGYLAFSRRLGGSMDWKATVTPLASIMGSGFLVSLPLLAGAVGNLAVFFMMGLLVLAYFVGDAIRFNIQHFEPVEHRHGAAQTIALLSRIVLSGAYFISVAYYLQLLAAFALDIIHVDDERVGNGLTTALLLLIGGIGMWRGLGTLEAVEKYAVSLNLGTIGALLVALVIHNLTLVLDGAWSLPVLSGPVVLNDLRVVLGLLIVVQGFETSRYLGDEHSAEQRVRTMKRAQLISSAVYLVFISLAMVLYHEGLGASVTAIISMTQPVAVVLPFLISVAAIGSQFSAAVADNAGAGGLIEDLSNNKVPIRYAYLLITLVTVAITWETNVNEIIAYASRAFALFYFLQSVVAWWIAFTSSKTSGRRFLLARFAIVALLCLLVFLLGIPSE